MKVTKKFVVIFFTCVFIPIFGSDLRRSPSGLEIQPKTFHQSKKEEDGMLAAMCCLASMHSLLQDTPYGLRETSPHDLTTQKINRKKNSHKTKKKIQY